MPALPVTLMPPGCSNPCRPCFTSSMHHIPSGAEAKGGCYVSDQQLAAVLRQCLQLAQLGPAGGLQPRAGMVCVHLSFLLCLALAEFAQGFCGLCMMDFRCIEVSSVRRCW